MIRYNNKHNWKATDVAKGIDEATGSAHHVQCMVFGRTGHVSRSDDRAFL
jgi:hypothetical protein